MARQFSSLFKNLNEMDDDELRRHISEVRRRKYIERPAAKRHSEVAAKPAATRKSSKVSKLVGQMSEAERLALLQLLEGESE